MAENQGRSDHCELLRAFHYRKKSNLVPLYKTFVRPRLEFAVAAWSPWTEADVSTLEKVQQRLIRAAADVRGQTYEEKLVDAGLTTLRERRARGDAIETFKTLRGINRVEVAEWFTVVKEDARPTRSNTAIGSEGEEERREFVLEVERANLEIRRNFFHIRATREWNEIPEAVKKQEKLNSFKAAYDAWKMRSRNTNQSGSAASESNNERESERNGQ